IPFLHILEDHVLAAGYKFDYFDVLNRFYVREESAGLAERFHPPCVFDHYRTLEECRKEEEIRCLREELGNFRKTLDIGKGPLKAGLAIAQFFQFAFGGNKTAQDGRKVA
ncbi:MAG: hypothetical protein ACKON9_25040, partial [Planctomycetaceae bacterium]